MLFSLYLIKKTTAIYCVESGKNDYNLNRLYHSRASVSFFFRPFPISRASNDYCWKPFQWYFPIGWMAFVAAYPIYISSRFQCSHLDLSSTYFFWRELPTVFHHVRHIDRTSSCLSIPTLSAWKQCLCFIIFMLSTLEMLCVAYDFHCVWLAIQSQTHARRTHFKLLCCRFISNNAYICGVCSLSGFSIYDFIFL